MRICVLQPSYEGSTLDYRHYDPPRDLSAVLPEATFHHEFLRKVSTYRQLRRLGREGFDVFVNLCEGYLDGDVPSLDVVLALEDLGLPYTGPPPALYDPPKDRMKLAAHAAGVAVPAHALVADEAGIRPVAAELPFPLFLKPNRAGDSLGIDHDSLVENAESLERKARALLAEYGEVLVEEYVDGREFTVLVCADPDPARPPLALRPLEFRFPPGERFKTYDLKVRQHHPECNRPSGDGALDARLCEAAVAVFRAFSGEAYARLDFRLRASGELVFLEANFACSVFYPEGHEGSADYVLQHDGMGQAGFLRHITREGLARHARRRPPYAVRRAQSGFGLFATRPLAPGETVFRGEGRAHRLVTRGHVERCWPAADQDLFRRYAYPVGPAVYVLWDADPSGWAPQNHSCEPNTGFCGLDVVALRSIAAGEERTLDYATFAGADMAGFECHCGSPRCRGWIGGGRGGAPAAAPCPPPARRPRWPGSASTCSKAPAPSSLERTMERSLALPCSPPEAQGVSSAALLAFVTAAEETLDALHSFVLLRHGHRLAAGYWEPYGPEHPHMLYFLSKSFASTAVGLAAAEGLLDLDAPVLSFFPQDAPAEPSENLQALRVRQLLGMATGHAEDTAAAFVQCADGNWIRAFLAQPVTHKPGTYFLYNSGATYMLSAIVQQVCGASLLEYLRPRLFAPLGIEGATWESSPQGIAMGGWGLSVRTDDIARLGQLYLQRGMWNGQRLLPEPWVAQATARQVSNGSNPASDWEQGYGYHFWRCRHGAFRGDGAFGQFCLVLPEQDAVLATTAGVKDMQAVLDVVWEHLWPALGPVPLPPDPGAHAALQERLGSLCLPPQPGRASSPLVARVRGRTYRFPANDRHLQAVSLDCGQGGFTLTLQDSYGDHRITCGDGAWRRGTTCLERGAPRLVAASGAWIAADTFAARLCFYETPHRPRLTLRFVDDKLLFDQELNVSFGPCTLPQLVGQAVP
ncbi:MAG: serine hydrolase [Candidatus Latescibacterota bacterium]